MKILREIRNFLLLCFSLQLENIKNDDKLRKNYFPVSFVLNCFYFFGRENVIKIAFGGHGKPSTLDDKCRGRLWGLWVTNESIFLGDEWKH